MRVCVHVHTCVHVCVYMCVCVYKARSLLGEESGETEGQAGGEGGWGEGCVCRGEGGRHHDHRPTGIYEILLSRALSMPASDYSAT